MLLSNGRKFKCALGLERVCPIECERKPQICAPRMPNLGAGILPPSTPQTPHPPYAKNPSPTIFQPSSNLFVLYIKPPPIPPDPNF